MSEKNCLNCVYCKKANQKGIVFFVDQNVCLKNPPNVIVLDDTITSIFPPVNDTMVCFQHLTKKYDAEIETSAP